MVALQLKNLIGGTREDARKMQSEGQTGDIAIAFDGVDALPGNARRLGKLLLGPAACRAQFFDSIAAIRKRKQLPRYQVMVPPSDVLFPVPPQNR